MMLDGMLRVLLIDRSRTFREAVAEQLDDNPDIATVVHVATVADAVSRMVHAVFDVTVVPADLASELLSLSRNGSRWESPPYVVVLAEHDDVDRAAALFRAGASGWVTRDASGAQLVETIRDVVTGQTVIPPDLLTRVVEDLSAGRSSRNRRDELFGRLTPREQEILAMLERGIDRPQIAATLHLSPNTVRTHIQGILQRLGVHSILAAVASVRVHGDDTDVDVPDAHDDSSRPGRHGGSHGPDRRPAGYRMPSRRPYGAGRA